jgi:hypothetical protein
VSFMTVSYDWDGLPDGNDYVVAVIAVNAVGSSAQSPWSTPTSTSVKFLPVKVWVLAVIIGVLVLILVLLKLLDAGFRCVRAPTSLFKCRVARTRHSAHPDSEEHNDGYTPLEEGVVDAAQAESAAHVSNYMSLIDVALAVYRLLFPMLITTLFYVSEPRKRTFLKLQLAAIAFALLSGVVTVMLFFRRVLMTLEHEENPVMMQWLRRHSSHLVFVKVLSIVKPSVLKLLVSNVFGADLANMPLLRSESRRIWT